MTLLAERTEPVLSDPQGRKFEYLRLSVEDACNFRCVYCLPNGYTRTHADEPLAPDEVRRLVGAFAAMGFWKVRVTGGEPTTRRDIVELVGAIKAAPGVERVALSTNGYRLAALAAPLARAGLSQVNVSVDSLDPARFARLTGRDELPAVLDGIEASLALGLVTKLNVVLVDDLSDAEIDALLALTREKPVQVRFIEAMPTGENVKWFAEHRRTSERLVARLEAAGWLRRPREAGDGPATRFTKPGHRGGAGVIAPYSKDFCASCNRLRVTSRGALRLCLFSEGELSLRPWLRSDAQRAELQAVVRDALAGKLPSHYLADGKFGATPNFAAMGG